MGFSKSSGVVVCIGERIAKRDQNGTVHTYEYDNLGRLLHDRITTLAANVDGAVRRISTVYDTAGNVKSVTSYDNATVGSGNVVNQVVYEYDANGLLAKDYSHPGGAVVVASTPYIGYTYDVTKSGDVFTKRLRLSTMKYPSGKTLTYTYGTANSVDDLLGRLTEIKEGATSLVQYAYNGAATPMKTTYPQPGLALDYTASGALDRFGRITDHAWKKGGADVVRIQHAYDRVGNRTNRTDAVNAASSEVYTYDGVNQIKSLNRGSSAFTETWNYDGTGNWLQYNRTGSAAENRTHNAANEVLSSCTHDRNGNMTVLPGQKAKYDGWNRLVEVRNSADTLLAVYGYNGLNQRVRKTVGSTVTESYFSRNWQELEAREPATVSPQWTTFIWGNRYIDDLVLREKGSEKLYSLADPNWNVVALANAAGSVVERLRYDAFGKVTWMDAAFAAKASSGYNWNRAFTGQVLDSESGLMLYRNRFYHTGLGRFVQRDSIGYDAGDSSLYRYCFNEALDSLDPFGYEKHGLTAGGFIIDFHLTDADSIIKGAHAHIDQGMVDGKNLRGYKVDHNGWIYTSKNQPTGMKLPKKFLQDDYLPWARKIHADAVRVANAAEQARLARAAAAKKARKMGAKMIPVVGTFAAIYFWSEDVEARGFWGGTANTAMDAIPYFGTAKGISEWWTGIDIIENQTDRCP